MTCLLDAGGVRIPILPTTQHGQGFGLQLRHRWERVVEGLISAGQAPMGYPVMPGPDVCHTSAPRSN